MATTHETTAHNNQDNGLAIASMVLGILSLTGFGFLVGIPAVVLGIISLKNKANNHRNLGIAGLVMGSIGTIVSLLFITFIILVAVFSPDQSTPTSYHTLHSNYDPTLDAPST
jgi:uncharacterized membrane protein